LRLGGWGLRRGVGFGVGFRVDILFLPEFFVRSFSSFIL
jgi:hypothetical protein